MMETDRSICDRIRRDAHRIVTDWEHRTNIQPWDRLPATQRIDRLPLVVAGLADASLCSREDVASTRHAAWEAVAHGEERREQGIPFDAIFREYYILRHALWAYVQSIIDDADNRVRIIGMLDMAITVATQASLLGYHRPELEKKGEWPDVVEEMIERAPIS